MVPCPSCSFENAESARFCNNCGTQLDAPRPVEGERKLATVLFADVAGSTALAERLDAEDWAAIMNGAFSFMNAAVARFGGTVARLMGDAVLAFFGAPVAQEDHAERAVRAGLALLEAADEYGRTVKARHGIDFELRVGINTGMSVLAFVGDAVKGEYTSMGDTANVAARLQSAARPGEVLIGADSHRLVRGLFEVESRGPLEMKGKQEPVETFVVRAARAVPGRTRGLDGLQSPLVGRERELAALRDRLAALASGTGAVVAVLGEAGLGKSRLVAELRAGVAAGGAGAAGGGVEGVAWYEGRAISYGQSLAYHPWQQLGRQMIGTLDADPPAITRSALAAFCDRVGVSAADVPLLETMLAVETHESRDALAGLDGDALVQRIADAVIGCIRASIHASGDAPRPHVLAFDDLHWSDSASLELLAQVATLAIGEPLLLICMLRPERKAPSWALLDRLRGSTGSSYLALDLEPLDGERSRELLGHLLHVEDLPDEIRALILQKSEGNPFFLEEVLRSLIDAGHVVRDNGQWRATSTIVDVTIPDTLAGVLGARIDRLPEPTKRVAQTAAVLGRIFPYRALTTVCRAAPPPERIENVDPHLGTLAYEELVRERARTPDREYIFKHALTQETAYGLLLKERRRELHLRAGLALEAEYPERLEELAPLLARHFHEGGDAQRTASHAMRAAERARKLFAIREALDHYDLAYQALDSLADPPAAELCDAVLGWTFIKYKLADYDGVIERLERAETHARAAGDKERLARILSWLATMHMLVGFPSRGEPYLRESHELAAEMGDQKLLLLPFFWSTEFLMDRDPAQAAKQLAEVIDMSRRLVVPEIEGHALASKALAHARLGEFDMAETYIRQALEAAASGGHRVKEADVHILVGIAYYEMGETDKGVEHTRMGAELADSVNAIECACAGFFGVGMGNLEQRELDEALDHFSRSLGLADYAGWEGYVNRIRAGVATAEFGRGRTESVAQLEQTLENARGDNDEFAMATIGLTLAEAYLQLEDGARARERLDAAMAFFRRTGMKPYLVRALGLAARVAEHDGRNDEAQAMQNEAAALRASFRGLAAARGP